MRIRVVCPKCNHSWSFSTHREVKCLSCGEDLYAKYPRTRLTMIPDTYEGGKSLGYLCHKCLKKILKEIET